MTDSPDVQHDTELARVLEVLNGARRAADDPDVELATRLHQLADADEAAFLRLLQQMLRDADSD